MSNFQPTNNRMTTVTMNFVDLSSHMESVCMPRGTACLTFVGLLEKKTGVEKSRLFVHGSENHELIGPLIGGDDAKVDAFLSKKIYHDVVLYYSVGTPQVEDVGAGYGHGAVGEDFFLIALRKAHGSREYELQYVHRQYINLLAPECVPALTARPVSAVGQDLLQVSLWSPVLELVLYDNGKIECNYLPAQSVDDYTKGDGPYLVVCSLEGAVTRLVRVRSHHGKLPNAEQLLMFAKMDEQLLSYIVEAANHHYPPDSGLFLRTACMYRTELLRVGKSLHISFAGLTLAVCVCDLWCGAWDLDLGGVTWAPGWHTICCEDCDGTIEFDDGHTYSRDRDGERFQPASRFDRNTVKALEKRWGVNVYFQCGLPPSMMKPEYAQQQREATGYYEDLRASKAIKRGFECMDE